MNLSRTQRLWVQVPPKALDTNPPGYAFERVTGVLTRHQNFLPLERLSDGNAGGCGDRSAGRSIELLSDKGQEYISYGSGSPAKVTDDPTATNTSILRRGMGGRFCGVA